MSAYDSQLTSVTILPQHFSDDVVGHSPRPEGKPRVFSCLATEQYGGVTARDLPSPCYFFLRTGDYFPFKIYWGSPI